MIRFDHVTFTYPGAPSPTLSGADFHVEAGELCLVVGPTGSGKSTLLKAVNGLVPRFTGGRLQGRVLVDGLDTAQNSVGDMAVTVGYVPQDPSTGFVTETVEDELAYTMEQLGLSPTVMRKRVEETLDIMGLAPLRNRLLKELSGGEAQRVAIGSVFAAHPPVLVLDEPTSALDPAAAEEVLATVTRLVHDLGTTVLMAEHRLERVVQYADRVIHLDVEGGVSSGEPEAIMKTASIAPPVVHLGRLAGWSPLPLSVRAARRRAGELVERLGAPRRARTIPGETLVSAEDLTVFHGRVLAVRQVDLRLGAGEVVALMGRNGAGKSSLLWALQGTLSHRGRVDVQGANPADLTPGEARRLVAMVPDEPTDMLFMESVGDECRRADEVTEAPAGTCLAMVERILGPLDEAAHPSDLSAGEKLGLVLAIQLSAGPRVLLLDEPTRGLDYAAKQRFAAVLAEVAVEGMGVMVATHDVEFVAEVASRVIVLAEGEIVADGPTSEVVVASPVFAPQVAKVLPEGGWLTVADVAEALVHP